MEQIRRFRSGEGAHGAHAFLGGTIFRRAGAELPQQRAAESRIVESKARPNLKRCNVMVGERRKR